jgi:integrase
MFKWGVGEELIPGSVLEALRAVPGLRRGRTEAPESEPVKPVPDEHVDAVKPHVSKQIWAMIELQRLTGMRPGEVVSMRGCDLDTTGKRLWIYRPATHKTANRGHAREIELGPRARKVLRPFLKRDLAEHLFSPRDAERERRAAAHAKRKTPASCGNVPGSNRKIQPTRSPRECYDTGTYRRAIVRACEAANVPTWHPHQLRHTYATRVRREYGIETARILLGHQSAVTSELYAEIDRTKARKVVAKIG